MTDKLKKLTSKNPQDFEPAAYNLVNDKDEELFAQLVEKEDFLFDFVKDNVAKRIESACNADNYTNLLSFLKYYSPSYEETIVSVLVKYADEDLTDRMLEIFENGTDEEKTYCAKFFSKIQDPLALDFLKSNAYSDNSALSSNCVSALAGFGDRTIYDESIDKLNSGSDFECLDAVRLLVSYGNKSAVDKIVEVMKKSPLAENIASELLYLCDLSELMQKDRITALYTLNLIIDGLGETICLSQVFDFQLYEIFEQLLNGNISSETSVVLLNAKEKFETLTENDEYLFDESKDVKQEIYDIKNLFNGLIAVSDGELRQDSLFVYTALELTDNAEKVRELLQSAQNQTIIIKSLEILKRLNALTGDDKNYALEVVNDENLINVIIAI